MKHRRIDDERVAFPPADGIAVHARLVFINGNVRIPIEIDPTVLRRAVLRHDGHVARRDPDVERPGEQHQVRHAEVVAPPVALRVVRGNRRELLLRHAGGEIRRRNPASVVPVGRQFPVTRDVFRVDGRRGSCLATAALRGRGLTSTAPASTATTQVVTPAFANICCSGNRFTGPPLFLVRA